MQLRVTARGDVKPLQTSLRGLNQQVNATMDNVTTSVQKAVHPNNELARAFERGHMSFRNAATAMRNHGKILREHNALSQAGAQVMHDANGNAQVALTVNRSLATTKARLAQRVMFLNTVLRATSGELIRVGKQMQWAGRQVLVGLGIPIAMLVARTSKLAEEYDRQMTRILKVNDDVSKAAGNIGEGLGFEMVAASVRRQADAIVDLGASMGFVSEQTATMIAEFSQMGYAGAQLDALSEAALRLSRTGGTELDVSMELTRLTASAFGVELDKLNESFARLNLIENNTALSLDEMAKGLPVVAGVASTLGLKIEETAGLMAMMKENGIGASEGATALRTGLLRMVQDATPQAIDAFERIGFSLEDVQEKMSKPTEAGGYGGDLMGFFDELSEKLQEIEARGGEAAQAGLNEFGAAISKMVGVRSSARFLTFLKEIGDRHDENTVAGRAWIGVTTEAAEAMRVYEFEERMVQESAAGIADILRAELNVELVRLGENFLGLANDIRQLGVDALRWFNGLSEGAQRAAFMTGGLLVAMGAGTMTLGIFMNAVGQVINVLSRLIGTFKLMTPALAAERAAYYDSTAAINTNTAARVANAAAIRDGARAASANATSQALAAGTMTATPFPIVGGAATAAKGADAAADAKKVGRVSTGIAAMGTRLTKEGSIISKLMAMFSKLAAKFAPILKLFTALGVALKAIGAFIAGIAAPLAAVAAVIGGIAILSDPQQFMASFREAISGPLDRFKAVLSDLGDRFTRIREMLSMMGGEGSGMSKMAEWVGKIAGWIGGVILDGLSTVLDLLQPVFTLFEAIMYIVEAIGHVLSGEGSEALSSMTEMVKALGRVFAELFASVVDSVANIVEKFEFMPGLSKEMADEMRDWGDSIRNAEALQPSITKEMVEQNAISRANRKLADGHAEALEESKEFMRELARAGVDAAKMSREDVMANVMLTDEMKLQVLVAKERESIEERINMLIEQRRALEANIESIRGRAESVGVLTPQAQRAAMESYRATSRAIEESQREINRLREESPNLHAKIRDEMNWQRDIQGFFQDDLEDIIDDTGDWNDLLHETTREQEAAAREAEKLRKEQEKQAKEAEKAAKEAEKLGDELEKAAQDKALEKLEKQAERLRDRIRESEQAAQAWANALKSGMGQVMGDIVQSVQNALQEQLDNINKAFETRLERAERSSKKEIEQINRAADRELARLDERVKREEQLERDRQRWFEQQKARIAYLQGIESSQITMREQLARGDLVAASITRINMQAETEKYMIESYERESKKFEQTKKDEIQMARDKVDELRKEQERAVNDTLEAVKAQLALEQSAAQQGYETRKRAIELYLEDWQRITPATEREFRQHLGNLTGFLSGFGIGMADVSRHYTQVSGQTIVNGFATAVDLATKNIAEDKKWEQAGRSSGAKFRAGLAKELAKIEGDIERLRDARNVTVSDRGITGSTSAPKVNTSSGGGGTYLPPASGSIGGTSGRVSRTIPNNIMTGWQYGSDWSTGRNAGISQLPKSSGVVGSRMIAMHTGGNVLANPNAPGLKRDEGMYVLQAGEYVVQQDAVKALGREYFERLNSIKRHSGGLIDFTGASLREAGVMAPMAGFGTGKLATEAAADIVTAGGGKPSIKQKATGTSKAETVGKAAGKQIGEVMESFLAFGPRSQAGGEGPMSAAGKGWPPRSWGKAAANTLQALSFIKSNKWGTAVSAFTGANRGDPGSDHSWGKAIDAMVTKLGTYPNAKEHRTGWNIANWFLANASAFGTKYVIWDKLYKTPAMRNWVDYTRYGKNPGPTLGHYDHPHISFLHDGGMVLPGLREGGKIRFDNTIANLHKGETVLTDRNTRALEQAIQNMAGGGGNTYELTIIVDGGNIDEDKLAKRVIREIETVEARKGRKRVIRG
jgi:TP901 family phage tail tape measure protein